MRGVLYFKLPSEEAAFRLATRAQDWALVAWDMDQWLREKLKHGHSFDSADAALEAARTKLHELLDDYGLNLDTIE